MEGKATKYHSEKKQGQLQIHTCAQKKEWKETHTLKSNPGWGREVGGWADNFLFLYYTKYSMFSLIGIYYYFLKFTYLLIFSNLFPKHGARTHDPETEAHALPTEPGKDPSMYFFFCMYYF